jgi:lipopolysaccharide export system permease protein
MARRFLRPFFFGLGLFALLIFLGDMFDKINQLVNSKASLGVILQYLWLEVPYWMVRVIPMATLLATLVAITGFIQSGEWIAAQASGFEPRDFWRPLLCCALAVTVLSFLAQETVLPACYRRARQLWQDKIHPEWEWDKYMDIVLIGGPDEFIQAKLFLPKEGRMDRPILEKVGSSGLERQLDARHALWDAGLGCWVFYDGVERHFSDGVVREEAFAWRKSELTAPPRSLIPRARNPDEMSLREIRRYSERISHLGEPVRQLRMAACTKVAYPFANLVVCALGIPIALRLRRAGKFISFFAALAVSFLYIWLMEIGRALGNGGRVPPIAAAWLANLLFAALAVWLLRREEH